MMYDVYDACLLLTMLNLGWFQTGKCPNYWLSMFPVTVRLFHYFD